MFVKSPKLHSVCLFSLLAIGLLTVILIAACSEDNPSSATPVELLVSPRTIEDSSVVGVPNQSAHMIKVNCDPIREEAPFSFSCDAAWIELSNLAGTNSGTASDSFSILFSVEDLQVGNYVDSVCVTSSQATNSPQYIEVNYIVKPEIPLLRTYPPWQHYIAETPDDEIAPRTVRIFATNDGNYDYTIDYVADWITLSGVSGVTPDTFEIMVDPSSIIYGAHVDTLWVHANDLTNSPQSVACSMYIHPWQLQLLRPENWVIYDIEFVDDQHGWAVGLAMDEDYWIGLLWKTLDGEQWEYSELTEPDVDDRYGLSALEIVGSEMWVVGQSGIIRYSPDLGQSWFSQSTGLADTTVELQDIKLVTSEIGWIVGEDGLILKTVDGGDTWLPQTSGTESALRACYFADENTGWIAGAEAVLRTTDGGETWQTVTGPFWDSRDVFFLDESKGWIVGSEGRVAFSDDGGINWTQQTTSFNGQLYAVFFHDESVGWVAGYDGAVLYTDDGGTTWTRQNTGSSSTIYSAKFSDPLRGWIGGEHCEIRYTNSGGN